MTELTIDEVIEHCNRTCERYETVFESCRTKSDSKTYQEHLQVREWLKELKELREKQIQKKVIVTNGSCFARTYDGDERFEEIYSCPNCGSGELKVGFPCKCGQRLDWSVEE